MEQQAEAKVFFVEPSPSVEPGVREQIESTAQAMAPVHDAFLREAIDSVDWERRGLLRRLSGRPVTRWGRRPKASPARSRGTGA